MLISTHSTASTPKEKKHKCHFCSPVTQSEIHRKCQVWSWLGNLKWRSTPILERKCRWSPAHSLKVLSTPKFSKTGWKSFCLISATKYRRPQNLTLWLLSLTSTRLYCSQKKRSLVLHSWLSQPTLGTVWDSSWCLSQKKMLLRIIRSLWKNTISKTYQL